MKNNLLQGLNPYLPPWEYIPDGEPYVFEGRIYVYGSHDRFNGHGYCLNDYACWSAPINEPQNWRYEGVIYNKADDPANPDISMCLYAPDVTVGPDGKYYLFYVLDKLPIVSVAVCDKPAGNYKFHGYVHYSDGTRLGEKDGDEPQFDPGVLTEGNRTYLYTGFCSRGDISRSGAMGMALDSDMLTIIEEPKIILPSQPYSEGSGFEGHEYFEAASIRKIGDTYYFIYSSIVMHELCYATSKNPLKGFEYQGVIVSNNDLHIDTYKNPETPAYYGGNNHGSIVELNNSWYVFYHRHTNGSNFCRQGCIEKIEVDKNGKIAQVEMTSCGINGAPLVGRGEYPTYIACNLFCDKEAIYSPHNAFMDNRYPIITQDGKDGDEEMGFIGNMMKSATAGFKYFDFKGVKKITLKVRGYCQGNFQIKTKFNGPVLATINVDFTNVWKEYKTDINIPDGVHPLYITYAGDGIANLASFILE